MAKKLAEHPETKKKKSNYATQKEVAEFLDITEFEVRKFIRLGLPKAGNNKFVLKDANHWYVNHLKYWSDRRTISEIATMLGITERWLNRLVTEKGITKEKRGTYKLDTTILSYANYMREQIKEAQEGEKSVSDERKRLISMQADLKQIELLEKQKSVFPVDLFNRLIDEYMTIVSKKIDSQSGMILNKLFASKTKEEMLKVLKESHHHIKTEIAKSESNIKISNNP